MSSVPAGVERQGLPPYIRRTRIITVRDDYPPFFLVQMSTMPCGNALSLTNRVLSQFNIRRAS